MPALVGAPGAQLEAAESTANAAANRAIVFRRMGTTIPQTPELVKTTTPMVRGFEVRDRSCHDRERGRRAHRSTGANSRDLKYIRS